MNKRISQEISHSPYWLEQSPQADAAIKRRSARELPDRADIVIIGSGYTGLSAALQTSRLGCDTIILDAADAGAGCSTRNGGQVAAGLDRKHSYLRRQYGETIADRLVAESRASLEYTREFISKEALACDFSECGAFHGAHNSRAYRMLAKQCEADSRAGDTRSYLVSKRELADELGTDAYQGGVVFPDHCSLNPAKYHAELMQLVENAGAQLKTRCRVDRIDRVGGGFLIDTQAGQIRAQKVILATNGYTGSLSPYHQKRVIPVGSYIIATDRIEGAVMNEIMPKNRIVTDTRNLVYYYRNSPDRTRVIFGGRVSFGETDTQKSAFRLHREMVRIFPRLRSVGITHSWMGFVGFTYDRLMHMGENEGLSHAMGYCGSGIAMASFLGMKIGRKAAGAIYPRSPFEEISFPAWPFYGGRPWFLAPAVMMYRAIDRIGL